MDLVEFRDVVEAFYQASKLHPEQVLGEFEQRNEPVPLLGLSTLRLPVELEYFCAHYQCNAYFGSLGVAITPFEQLARRQEGFSSFSTDSGKTMQPNPTWNPHWTVFADLNDDSIVADASQPGTPVYAAIEAVDYAAITPSLTAFFKLLTAMLNVTASLKEQQPATDDTEAWITFGTEVEAPATLLAAEKILAHQYVEAVKHFFYS